MCDGMSPKGVGPQETLVASGTLVRFDSSVGSVVDFQATAAIERFFAYSAFIGF